MIQKNNNNPRFYVMALEDFMVDGYTTFYWYKSAFGKMSTWEMDTSVDFGTGYANTGKIIDIWNKNGEGEDSYIGATNDNQDIWKHIQQRYNEKWYIPSRGEWAAFADYFTTRTKLTIKLTSNNYNNKFRLSSNYWSSSQHYAHGAFFSSFTSGRILGSFVDTLYSVRLGTTF